MIKKELACVRRLSPSSEQTQSSQCLHICRRLAASWDKLGGESAQGCWWLRSELTTIKVRSPSQSSSKVSSTVSASISRTCRAVHYPGSLARFARALHTAIKKGRGDPTFSPREKVARRGG